MAIVYRENDNLNQKAIDQYMKLSDDELDELLKSKLKEVQNNK